MRGKGCRRCVGSGYIGRVGVFELFEVNDQFRRMIVHGLPPDEIRRAAEAEGMKSLVDDGVNKIARGITTVEEIARIAGRC